MANTSLIQLLLVASICILANVKTAEAQNKRCTWIGAKTFRACKLSCKALGHDTGVCDDQDRCICSENEYDFLSDVSEWISEKLDPSTLIARMDTKFNEYKNKFKNWTISENLRPLVPSKCKISESFCNKACQAIGRYNGVCNADKTDCDCSEDWVTPKQYGLCANDMICRLDCQANGKATGDCVDKGSDITGWDCKCSSKADKNVPRFVEYDNSEDVETFDARRKKRSMWTNNMSHMRSVI